MQGESRPKHVVVLEVMGDKWRTIKYPLQTVRPFKFKHIVLSEHPVVQSCDPDSVSSFLEAQIQKLIDEVQKEVSLEDRAKKSLPLIRLRVDYSGFSTVNSQRLGQKFVSKVANPHDIVLWAKSTKRK